MQTLSKWFLHFSFFSRDQKHNSALPPFTAMEKLRWRKQPKECVLKKFLESRMALKALCQGVEHSTLAILLQFRVAKGRTCILCTTTVLPKLPNALCSAWKIGKIKAVLNQVFYFMEIFNNPSE